MEDYLKFVIEPYAVCPSKVCNQHGLKFIRITVSENYVNLYSECEYCCKVVNDKVRKEDMIHFGKLFLEENEIGTEFTRFKLGLFHPALLYTSENKKQYKAFFLELLKELRTTVLKYKGQKIMRPNLGATLEKLLNDEN